MTRTTSNLGRATLLALACVAGGADAQYYGGLHFDTLARLPVTEVQRGFFVANTALDDRRVRYGLKLGYQFAPGLSMVTNYSEYDRRDASPLLSRRYGLDIVRSMTLMDRLSLSGSAGIARLRGGNGIEGGLPAVMLNNLRAASVAKLGFGVQYQFSGSVGIRFDVERFRSLHGSSMGELDADNMSLGVMLRF